MFGIKSDKYTVNIEYYTVLFNILKMQLGNLIRIEDDCLIAYENLRIKNEECSKSFNRLDDILVDLYEKRAKRSS